MDNQITNRQVVLLGAMCTFNITLMHIPVQVTKYAKQHAYLSYLAAGLVVLLAVWLLVRTLKRFNNQSILQALVSRFPSVGRIIALLYLLFYFFIVARDLRMLTDFTNVVLLPSTPLFVVEFIMIATIVFVTRGGMKVLTGMTNIFGPVLILTTLFMPFILVKDFDYSLLMPVLHIDYAGVGKGSWFAFSYLGEIIAFPLILSSQTFRFKDGLLGLLCGVGLLMLLIVLTFLLIGAPLTTRMTYPTYELVRQLEITDFLDRFDILLVAIWFPTVITKIAVSLYVVCYGLKIVIPQISGRMLVAPIGLLSYVCSFWFFENSIHLFSFNRQLTVIGIFFELILPLLLFLILRPKNKGVGHKI
ncbi:endospore germination permease [Paenibacillus sediminis]|uniref:Spore germination protein n=1 Tax=Paenibacillus sediminis TaxID=664909 RepID=A0ABS4H2I9_9BACL|nr:endospore germination permease [Paenibacillus sediminis]MBP1936748.1 spore germination protein [Paenibacillus sediminis]